MTDQRVKCNGCGYIGKPEEFPRGRDFFQNAYIASCPKKCGNSQSPGDASMRMFDRSRPFSYVDEATSDDPLTETLLRAEQAS